MMSLADLALVVVAVCGIGLLLWPSREERTIAAIVKASKKRARN